MVVLTESDYVNTVAILRLIERAGRGPYEIREMARMRPTNIFGLGRIIGGYSALGCNERKNYPRRCGKTGPDSVHRGLDCLLTLSVGYKADL